MRIFLLVSFFFFSGCQISQKILVETTTSLGEKMPLFRVEYRCSQCFRQFFTEERALRCPQSHATSFFGELKNEQN